MKKVILTVCLLLVGVAVQAQNWRFGVYIGGNSNSVPGFGESGLTTDKLGYEFGGVAEYHFGKPNGLFVDAGLSKVKTQWELVTLDMTSSTTYSQVSYDYHPGYLKLPIHVGYQLPVMKNLSLSLAAGPYVSCGIFGRGKVRGVTGTIPGRFGEIPYFSPMATTKVSNVFSNGVRRFDSGLDFRFNADICHHWRIGVGYQLGLTRVVKTAKSSGNPKGYGMNRLLSIQVGYMF